ncbi:MAG: hypothetical protein JWO30_4438 [Fibrobacteres bacterium]|nr:hypothetical protein [Fibrobacterota bacterium]
MYSALEKLCEKMTISPLHSVLVFAFLCTVSARAETIGYSGKVIDETGAGVPWALIKVDGSDVIGQSGADGSFTLSGNGLAAAFYADPKPQAPFSGVFSAGAIPDRYLLTGRAASGRHVAATLLLSAPIGDASAGKTFPLANAPRTRIAAAADADRTPPPPPVLSKPAAAYNLIVTMAHYRTETFPQAAPTAKSISLTLAASATDTAMYAAEKKLCLDTINAYRAMVGAKAVTWSKSLEAFADQGARYDAERNVAHGHFSAYSKYAVPSDAENAIPGWPLKSYKTVAAVVAEGAKMMWAEGPGGGHYENIKGSHTQVGCGIYVTPTGAVWVIHDFK